MGPKINGKSAADLVLAAVQQQLEVKMGDYKDLLNNALARINTLEEEIALCRQNSNPTFYRTQVSLVRSMGLVVSHSLTHRPFANLTDVTLADEDTKLCKLCKLCK